MSIIGTNILVSEELEKRIKKEVIVEKKMKVFGPRGMKTKTILVSPIRVIDNKIYIPFNWALKNTMLQRRDRNEFTEISARCTGVLNEKQKEIKAECIDRLNKNSSILLSLHVGWGKSFFALYLACKIGMKTMIITHRNVLYDQWKESILEFTNTKKISIIKPKNGIDQYNNDFLIVSPDNIKKIGYEKFKDVHTVIIDEIHLIVAERLAECLTFISPRILIGLSATPTRPDGMDKLIDFYFGTDNKITKELYHKHIVYKIDTDYVYDYDAKDWNALLSAQCFNEERNKMIIKLVLKYTDNNFLLLCKRNEQAEYLYEKLIQNNQKASLLIKNENEYSDNSRILVASYSKCAVGFSCKKLDSLILCSDVISNDTSDFMVQIIGRIFRRHDVNPVIFDIVDAQKVFKTHFNVRKKCYLKHGGEIIDLQIK